MLQGALICMPSCCQSTPKTPHSPRILSFLSVKTQVSDPQALHYTHQSLGRAFVISQQQSPSPFCVTPYLLLACCSSLTLNACSQPACSQNTLHSTQAGAEASSLRPPTHPWSQPGKPPRCCLRQAPCLCPCAFLSCVVCCHRKVALHARSSQHSHSSQTLPSKALRLPSEASSLAPAHRSSHDITTAAMLLPEASSLPQPSHPENYPMHAVAEGGQPALTSMPSCCDRRSPSALCCPQWVEWGAVSVTTGAFLGGGRGRESLMSEYCTNE